MEDIQEIIVENIDSSKFEADDLFFGEDGKVTSAFDRNENKRYVIKGNETPKDEPKEENKLDEKVEQPSDKTEGQDKTDDNDDDSNDEEFENPAHYVLKRIGYTKDEVDFGEGGKVKIADLTPEQQMDIIVSEFDNQIEALQKENQELKEKGPAEIKFDNPQAQQIVDYLKNGGDIQKLAKEIISRDPAAQAKIMTDVEVVKAAIKKEFPEFTEDDIEDEVKDLTPEKIARRAKALRAKMEKEGPSFADLTEEQKKFQEQELEKVKKAHQDEVEKFRSKVKEIKQIGGIPINDQVRDFLFARTIPKDFDQDSEFVAKLQNNPEKIFRMEFLDTYFEHIVKSAKEAGIKEGMTIANKGKDKLSDEPVRTYNGIKTKAEKKQEFSPEKDFDKWLASTLEF